MSSPRKDGSTWQVVHGGATRAWVKPGAPTECNAFCKPPVHCDLIYVSAWADAALVDQVIRGYRVGVIRVEPAREAPAPAQALPTMFQVGAPTPEESLSAWLVFWRANASPTP